MTRDLTPVRAPGEDYISDHTQVRKRSDHASLAAVKGPGAEWLVGQISIA
jgi:hypothetical protein